MILADYTCPACDADVELLVPSPAPDEVPCPACGGPASWLPAPVCGRVRLGEVSRGRVAPVEHAGWTDTRELGEGMPMAEWRAKRAKWRMEERRKRLKEQLG